jgi:tripartite-type tricarboxylate transporter receptor subunit TctC
LIIGGIALTNGKPQLIARRVPTVSEAGFLSLTTDWLVGFFTPKASGEQIREQIATDVKALADAEPWMRNRGRS